MKKIKKLCGVKKSVFNLHKEEIVNITKKPRFICKKCMRVSNEKKYLCNGEAMDD